MEPCLVGQVTLHFSTFDLPCTECFMCNTFQSQFEPQVAQMKIRIPSATLRAFYFKALGFVMKNHCPARISKCM